MKRTIAFQGIQGAYSEDATYLFFGDDIETVPCPDFETVFNKVDKGEALYGVVPVENSLEGSITLVNDLLLDNDLTVVGEVLVAINHCLIAHPSADLKDIKSVYSHPQALGQCRSFLNRHSWEKIPAFDTAGSVKMIKERGKIEEAAIASKRAAAVYEMKVLAEGIQNRHDNFTRFFVIQRTASLLPDGDKTSLVFATRNIPGALYDALGSFAKRGINMTKVESRPRKERTWEYVFFVDIDGHVDDDNVADALTDLVRKAAFVKVLGSYKKANAPPA